MATTTENLGMTLPATTDPVDVTVLNGNFSALDAFAGQQTEKEASQDDAIAAKATVRDIMGAGTAIEAGTDLDTITTFGTYSGASNAGYLNCPITSAFRLEVVAVAYNVRRQQRLYPQSATMSAYYIRSEGPSGFGSWYRFTGEVVS